MTRLINDVQENVRRFNEDEAVWRSFVRKRARRRKLALWFRLFAASPPLSEEQLDPLDWLAAERETRPTDCVGKQLP